MTWPANVNAPPMLAFREIGTLVDRYCATEGQTFRADQGLQMYPEALALARARNLECHHGPDQRAAVECRLEACEKGVRGVHEFGASCGAVPRSSL